MPKVDKTHVLDPVSDREPEVNAMHCFNTILVEKEQLINSRVVIKRWKAPKINLVNQAEADKFAIAFIQHQG